MKQIIVDILPCQPIYGAMAQDYYSYLCPEHLRGMAVTGQLCLMPFGNKQFIYAVCVMRLMKQTRNLTSR